jgi:hypothetical protein
MRVQVLEWGITALGFLASWLLAGRNRYGWAASIACQLVWLYVAWVTRQWAFVPGTFVYGALAVRGWRAWK